MSANASRAVADRARRDVASMRLGLGGPGDDVGLRLVHRGVPRSRVERLGVPVVVGEVAVEQLEQAGVAGAAVARAISTGSVGTPSRRSVPGVLPETPASEATSRMSSESWNAVPTMSPYAVSASSHLRRGAAEHGAVARGGGDQGAGLAGHDVEVVRERVLAGAGLERLEDLALDEPGERLRLDAYGVRRRARRSARRTSRTGSRR